MRPGSPDEQPLSSLVIARESEATSAADCRTCAARSSCISYGWRSPTGLWFEGAVVLRPRPGCRGFVGRGDDIREHFVHSTAVVKDH
ncbi:MAG: hypothetical protein ABTQ29_02840 [Siculibacillus sp.]